MWALERQVTAGHVGDAEQFLEELFRVRHGLLAVRTMAALSREVYGRMARAVRSSGRPARPLLADLEDQFRRIAAMADAQREYLQGVIEFYQTRTNTKMTDRRRAARRDRRRDPARHGRCPRSWA